MNKLICAVSVLAVATAQADIIYVDADCPGGDGSELDPYCSIQTAIDNAVHTDEVVVAPGTYFEAINFLGKAVWLHSSDGPEVTIIDATDLFSSVVTCDSGEGLDTVLDGFRITGGTGTDPGTGFTRGGGMYNDNSNPTITDCTFTGNVASGGGGMYNEHSSPTVAHCAFIANSAEHNGGGMFNHASQGCAGPGSIIGPSNPAVISCIFVENTAGQGGAISNWDGSSPEITHSTFSQNTAAGNGGAVNNTRCCTPTIINCKFIENSANRSGGGIRSFFHSDLVVIDCTFIGNSAQVVGGGMGNFGSSPTVTNCTFSDNTAEEQGGATANRTFVYLFGSVPSNPAMSNCIVWDNAPDAISDESDINPPSESTVRYSNVQGSFAGTGNIDTDPLFVDPLNADFRLAPGSPCIDAGNNNAIADLADTDLDGNPRFADDPDTQDTGCGVPVVVDMGAYEYQGVPADVVFADLNGDGSVGVLDLVILNGCIVEPDCCVADLDLDGEVGMSDRLLMWAIIGMVEFSPVR